MCKQLNLGLITIGSGDWKKVIKSIWKSLESQIEENPYYLQRAKDEYKYKMEMDNIDLPSYLTNYPIKLKDDCLLNVTISMPVESKYINNDKMLLLPWYNEKMCYKLASEICSERIIWGNKCDRIILLCGENLDLNEREFKDKIISMCERFNKKFWEIGNDCECMNIANIIKWIESEENYCCYDNKNVKIIL